MSSRYSGGVIRKNQLVPTTSSASGVWDLNEATQSTKSDIWPYSGIANPISQSLRIRRANSAYLQRTPATQTNRSTWTYSFWHKRGLLSASQSLITAGTGGNIDTFTFNSSDKISIDINNSTRLVSTQVFRDSSAWYHFVWYYDATQGTASNRMKVYVNGVEITAFDTDTRSSISSATSITNTTVAHRIGYYDAGILYTDGYMADVNFIDGQALDPSYFGQTSAITGVWEPKQYSGTYGTNGWHLEFKDTTVGQDTSGNNNDWTPNNISTTLGSTYDLMTDVPTQWAPRNTTDVGGVVRGNYATFNPLAKGANVTLSEGNLKYSTSSASGVNGIVSMRISTGMKSYFEFTCGSVSLYRNISIGGVTYVGDSGSISGGTGGTGTFATWTTGDVIRFACDYNAGTIACYKNATLQTTVTGVTNTSEWEINAAQATNTTGEYTANFGQRPFAYTPPSGFNSLCTTNIPAPTIGATTATAANKYFDATLITGTAATQVITNAGGFQPDFVWLKSRTNANNPTIYDAIRGVNTVLYPALTNAEQVGTAQLTAFNSNGFTLGASENANDQNGEASVGWQWRGANGTVSNTAGTITSTVSANTSAGFSVVTYTGNGTSGATVGHGLGVTPSMVILKPRSTVTNWQVKHTSLNANQNLELNSTAAVDTAPGSGYISAISSTTLTLLNGGSAITNVNGSGTTYVAYCFAPIAGYSAFGTYTGNGSTDGPFVYTGFRPRYVMVKNTVDPNNWTIFDTARNTYNIIDLQIYPTSDAEAAGGSSNGIDFLSNGFKLRSSFNWGNRAGDAIIYMAFAEHPFKNSLAR